MSRAVRGIGATAAAVLVAGLLAGCSGGDDDSAQSAGSQPVSFAITPQPGAKDVDPNAKVTVRANGGKINEVRVTDGLGQELTGAYSPDHLEWTATAPVKVDATYAVHVWGDSSDGQAGEQVARFTTADVERSGSALEIASVQPKNKAQVGVGHPLIVTFNQSVTDKATVQKALQVKTTPPVPGAWYWIDNATVDYRPEQFWPANTKVTLTAKLKGISAGDGVVGGANKNSSFTVGRSQILTVDVKQHKLTVTRDGQQIKSYDVSTGKPGWETRNGTKVIMDKERNKVWTNEAIDAKEDYRYKSKYAMRITNSGEFVHDAPWNTGNIGEANTSHGCIGLVPKAMDWLYKNTLLGDPVVVVGSPKPFDDLQNRIADWNVPWEKWSAGNATQADVTQAS